jgi:magnesium transporter
MFSKLVLPEFEALIEKKDWNTLKNALIEMDVHDIAEVLGNLDEKEAVVVFRLVPKEKASDVFAELDPALQEYLLQHIVGKDLKALLEDLSPDDRTALFEDLPGQMTQKLLNILPPEERKESLQLLGYPEESVGRLMTPDYVAVRPQWTIGKAIEHIKKMGRDAETINVIYVVDDHWKLVDDIPIRRFLLAELDQSVADIMDHKFVAIEAQEDQEQAYQVIKKYNLNVLPVVDREGILLGIVTVDDILDVIEEEVTEDFQKTSAIVPIEESYYTVGITTLYKKRAGWLMLLLVADFLSSSVIAHFQDALQAVIALAFFIPVLIDTGGNIASQSSTLIIRALAMGELTIRKWFSVVKKELLIGLMLGLTLGSVLYIRSFFWRGGPSVGMVVGMAMMVISLWANLLGSLLPIVLTRFKLDPAVISSPLLTTVVDSTGLLIYFSLARGVFHF